MAKIRATVSREAGEICRNDAYGRCRVLEVLIAASSIERSQGAGSEPDPGQSIPECRGKAGSAARPVRRLGPLGWRLVLRVTTGSVPPLAILQVGHGLSWRIAMGNGLVDSTTMRSELALREPRLRASRSDVIGRQRAAPQLHERISTQIRNYRLLYK